MKRDKMDAPPLTQDTLLTQLGRNPQAYDGFVNTPIVRGSTVLYPNAEALETHHIPYTYGRPSTPTSRALEEAIASLEGGHRTYLTPSGLSAVSTTLLAFAEKDAHILISDSVYQPTRRFAERVLRKQGIDVEYYDPLIGKDISTLLRDNTSLIFTESPGSQTFEIQDIPAISQVAKTRNIPVAIDNTWATPLYFRAFDHGVNISIQSLTKYVVGHADALLGAITCDQTTAPNVYATYEALGLCANPEDCFLALRGLRTLAVRLAQHQRSGLEMAYWLQNRPEVETVIHPALEHTKGHELWKRDFKGASGLFAIMLKPYAKEQVNRMLNALNIFGMGYSWGGFESLIVPFDCRAARTATTWDAAGFMLRLHIGLEHTDDLKRDLEQGFAALDRL